MPRSQGAFVLTGRLIETERERERERQRVRREEGRLVGVEGEDEEMPGSISIKS